jgi:uncharacterized protein with HEPN domain
MRRYATERQLQTLGEAANHISRPTQAGLPSIEWSRSVRLSGVRIKTKSR